MDTILQFLTGVLRYVLPVLALLILAVWWTKITAP